jgi:hypothetical protein
MLSIVLTGCARPGCRRVELRVLTVVTFDDASLRLSPCVTLIQHVGNR